MRSRRLANSCRGFEAGNRWCLRPASQPLAGESSPLAEGRSPTYTSAWLLLSLMRSDTQQDMGFAYRVGHSQVQRTSAKAGMHCSKAQHHNQATQDGRAVPQLCTSGQTVWSVLTLLWATHPASPAWLILLIPFLPLIPCSPQVIPKLASKTHGLLLLAKRTASNQATTHPQVP